MDQSFLPVFKRRLRAAWRFGARREAARPESRPSIPVQLHLIAPGKLSLRSSFTRGNDFHLQTRAIPLLAYVRGISD